MTQQSTPEVVHRLVLELALLFYAKQACVAFHCLWLIPEKDVKEKAQGARSKIIGEVERKRSRTGNVRDIN